jgi:hypothetical protein
MLSRALGILVVTFGLAFLTVAPRASADEGAPCPPGTNPVSVGSGVICVVVTDPGEPGQPGDPGDPGDGGQVPAGCYKSDGTQVPCQTGDGTWWSGSQCYAAPYDAPPGTAAWQGHTDGSLWQCTSCTSVATTTISCNVQIISTAPGQEPGPPTPEELASTALGLMPLAQADIHTAPTSPAATYVGVENWLWVPNAQWATLSKSVSAGGTTVTVTASPTQILWNLGPTSLTCYGPGKPWVQGMTDAASTNCGFTYPKSSEREPNRRFSITAIIRYQVAWSCTGTCAATGGDLGLVDAPAGASTMRVLQRQTVETR